MSLLSDFLTHHAIAPELVLAESGGIERRSIADRALGAKRSVARRLKKAYPELKLDKPKGLSRAVSADTLKRAMAGEALPRLLRKKIARAVNAALVGKKKDVVDARALFGDVPSKKGAAKKKS